MTEDQTKSGMIRPLLGLSIIAIGFFSPALTPLIWDLNLSDSIKSILSGALIFGIPELMILVGISIMGKESWNWMKSKMVSYLEFISPQRVSKSMYYTGVILFSVCIIEGVIELHVPSFQVAVSAALPFSVWVLNGLFVLSFFIAGGEFWDKIRALFIYSTNV